MHRSDSEIEKFNETDSGRLEENETKSNGRFQGYCNTEVVSGNPTKVILSSIKKNDCSLVVIVKQGKGFVQEFIVGGTTRKIMEESGINSLYK